MCLASLNQGHSAVLFLLVVVTKAASPARNWQEFFLFAVQY